jgi:hypothetical protein
VALTEIHKEKIRAAMKGRQKGVPKAEEHKRRIAFKVQVGHQNTLIILSNYLF